MLNYEAFWSKNVAGTRYRASIVAIKIEKSDELTSDWPQSIDYGGEKCIEHLWLTIGQDVWILVRSALP